MRPEGGSTALDYRDIPGKREREGRNGASVDSRSVQRLDRRRRRLLSWAFTVHVVRLYSSHSHSVHFILISVLNSIDNGVTR